MGQCIQPCSSCCRVAGGQGGSGGPGGSSKVNLTSDTAASLPLGAAASHGSQHISPHPPASAVTMQYNVTLHHQYNGATTPTGVATAAANTGYSKTSSVEKQATFPYPKFTLPAALSVKTLEGKRSGHSQSYNEQKINILFEIYKDPDEDAILYEGVEKLCKDLDVDPEDFKILLLAWKFNAERMCVFTRPEFIQGCKAIRADNIKTMRERFPELLNEVRQDKEKFKELYRFTFRFGLEPGMRVLPLNIAIALWNLVFSENPPAILERWLKFLDKHEIKGIPRDTWNMFLNFVECVGNDLSLYDDTEAWPSLLDDFVEYETDARNQNTPDFDKSNQ